MTDPVAVAKPTPSRRRGYDFMTVRDYLNARYGRDMDDYAGYSAHQSLVSTQKRALIDELARPLGVDGDHYWRNGSLSHSAAEKALTIELDRRWPAIEATLPPQPELESFWIWICEHKGISNGANFSLSDTDMSGMPEEWQREVLGWFLDTFAPRKGEIKFYVSW